jgi:hypothetical protein
VNGTLVRILSPVWNKVRKSDAKQEQLILEIIGATMTPEFHRLPMLRIGLQIAWLEELIRYTQHQKHRKRRAWP